MRIAGTIRGSARQDKVVGAVLGAAATLLACRLLGRREREEVLRRSEAHFRTVVEALDEGILLTDLEDMVLDTNLRLAELTGYAREEMVGRPAYELLLPPERWAEVRRRNEQRAKGASEGCETRLRRRDGTTFWAEVNAMPYRDEAGRPLARSARL